ncbi:MAG: hypothetical protein Q8N26_08920 [Myxococcales bacterium]|nr:hypothetical protein [Myxococcales bacterium]
MLDTPPEPAFDALTALAAHIAGLPIALVSLVDVDRQWFKSGYGLEAPQTPRDVSFCGHVVAAERLLRRRFRVEDLRARWGGEEFSDRRNPEALRPHAAAL